MTLKEEWLAYSGLNRTPEDIWLRNKIAKLFDLEAPSESQSYLRHMADLRLTLADLPDAAYPNHEAELRALALKEFGPPPLRVQITTSLTLRLLRWMQKRGLT